MPKKKKSSYQQRAQRKQQIIMGIIGVLVILSMIVGMLTRY